jgi:hypothetical protein
MYVWMYHLIIGQKYHLNFGQKYHLNYELKHHLNNGLKYHLNNGLKYHLNNGLMYHLNNGMKYHLNNGMKYHFLNNGMKYHFNCFPLLSFVLLYIWFHLCMFCCIPLDTCVHVQKHYCANCSVQRSDGCAGTDVNSNCNANV